MITLTVQLQDGRWYTFERTARPQYWVSWVIDQLPDGGFGIIQGAQAKISLGEFGQLCYPLPDWYLQPDGHSDGQILTEAELIAQAQTNFGGSYDGNLLAALQAFYSHDQADQQAGNPAILDGHVYRVHRWLVWTNFGNDVTTYANDLAATQELNRYAAEVAALA